MKFIDLFAGIGGFRTGMEMNGHECVAFCEIDKHARQSYKAMYETEGEEEIHDITEWTDEHIRQFVQDRGHIDCITGGFPCQSFSIAGKRGGFEDTRGTLFFEIMRIANIIRPQYLFLENVKGLLNHDGGSTFETILNTMDEFGYDAEWQVLNSKNFGVPQNRERVFIIGHLRGKSERTVFPVGKANGGFNPRKITSFGKWMGANRRVGQEVLDPEGVFPTLTTKSHNLDVQKIAVKEGTRKGYKYAQEGDGINLSFPTSHTRRGRVGEQISNTLLTGSEQGVVTNDLRIRRLTPLECWRLQGFTDEQFYKAKNSGVSENQLYKQAGNSVTVNVIDAIAQKLL